VTPALKFSPGNHQYRLDGKHIKGVTTLIKGGMPNDALMYWSARRVAEFVAENPDEVTTLRRMGTRPMVEALKNVPWQERDEKAARGTNVHELAAQVAAGAEVDVPEHLLGHVEGYVNFLDRWDVRPVLTEAMGANREHWYAGTFDLIADIGPDRWLLDLKTAGRIYGKDALQTDAYRHFEFWQNELGEERPMPEGITRLGAVHITEAGSELVPLTSDGTAFEDFLKVSAVARRTKDIEAHVGTALPTPEHALGGAA
jgi:hypothetical protein